MPVGLQHLLRIRAAADRELKLIRAMFHLPIPRGGAAGLIRERCTIDGTDRPEAGSSARSFAARTGASARRLANAAASGATFSNGVATRLSASAMLGQS